MAKRFLRVGDRITALCGLIYLGAEGEAFRLDSISEAADGPNCAYYDEGREESYEVKVDEALRWYYDDEEPL